MIADPEHRDLDLLVSRFLHPRRDLFQPSLAPPAGSIRRDSPGGLALTTIGAGPPVLCLHGWEGWSYQFLPYAELLAPRGYDVLLIDGPAHGRSPGEHTDPLHFALDIAAAVAPWGPLSAIIGHSMGAAAALLAVAHGLAVQRIVLIASPFSYHGVVTRAMEASGLTPEEQVTFVALLERRLGYTMADVDLGSVRQTITQPTLIIHDELDKEVPIEEARRLAEGWPSARLVTSRGLGHRRILRDPWTLATVDTFLGAGDPPPTQMQQ